VRTRSKNQHGAQTPAPLAAALLVLLTLAAATGGCTRAYVSTGDPGEPCPDGSTTRICWTIHGAYGRSYVDRTKKLLDVCIKRGPLPQPQILFLQRYKFVASDLWGDAQWISTNEVVVQFYDYGPGLTSDDARNNPGASNYIASLAFRFDNASGKFVEKK
jgi:hypothetical protein